MTIHNSLDNLVINQNEIKIKEKILNYEKSYHFKEILFTIAIFLIF
jgi:hypothetical protein